MLQQRITEIDQKKEELKIEVCKLEKLRFFFHMTFIHHE